VVGLYAALCGVLFTLLHGHPERILVLGGGGALAGAAAGALTLGVGSLFETDLFEDLVRLVFRRKPGQIKEENHSLVHSPPPQRTQQHSRHGLPGGQRWNGRGATTSWDETYSSN